MKHFSALTLFGGCLALTLQVQAQWTTQTLNLRSGWNAIFLHVDASHATLHQLVGVAAPTITPIEQVWRWNVDPTAAQFIVSPQEPLDTGSQWTSWKRAQSATSPLQQLTPNTAYLVFSTANYTWQLKGRPRLPAYLWSSTGLNLFGFATPPASPPSFESFLSAAPALLNGEIYRYAGGAFGPNNPARLFALRTTAVNRGEAYWLRAGDSFNEYFGPFVVTTSGSGQAEFGDSLSTFSFRLKNLTANPLTVNLTLRTSEAPPAGQTAIAATPPLLVRGARNPVTLAYAHAPLVLGTPTGVALAASGQPGDETEVVLGLDRASITATAGSLLAGVLELSDSLGHTRLDMAVSARPGSLSGLWVGGAAVNGVSQYLQQYLRDGDGQLELGEDGRYTVTSVITNITDTPTPFPLRLIVHNPDSGPATLLQRAYLGFNAISNPVIALTETGLNRNLLAGSRRISASHLPWTGTNTAWAFSGPLGRTTVLVTTVSNRFDAQESNPFLHTYHPDHDNLDPRFRQEVPQGSESYTIAREITLRMRTPGDDFESRVSAGLTLTGDYLETIRVLGLARGTGTDARRFDVRGVFQISRISEVPTLTRTP